jgi:phytoene dehydrogenase-like protein
MKANDKERKTMKPSRSKPGDPDVIVIGAGLSGLACGRILLRDGFSVMIMEGSDSIGGRLKTDRVEGFLLDHGFQVLQTAYPEAQKTLNYRLLKLRAFDPGAVIRLRKRFYRVADPLRCPRYGIETLLSPVGTVGDKFRLIRLLNRICGTDDQVLFRRSELDTLEYLKKEGFTEKMIRTFFRPFFSGVCLDPHILASNRVFHFVFKMLALGDAALPAKGIRAIPAQLATDISEGTIFTRTPIVDMGQCWVRPKGGERIHCRAVVIATDGPQAHRLLGAKGPVSSCGVHCLYFAAEKPPFQDNLLVINGDEGGLINNLTVVSNVAPSYAPAGQSLIGVTVLDASVRHREALETDVRNQLEHWYGQSTHQWRLLKIFHITHGLPLQRPPTRRRGGDKGLA